MNGLIFALLRWLVPFAAHREYPDDELEEFSKRHRWLDYVGIALFLVILLPFSAVTWTAALVVLERLQDSMMPPHLLMIRLQPDWLIWAPPGMFLGIISGGWLLSISYRMYFGNEFCKLMQAAENHKAKYDAAKAFRWMSVGIVTLSMAWVVLELDWYTRLEGDNIVINPLFGFGETTYSYNQITDLVESTHFVAPNGKLVERTRQLVLFDDGEYWCHDGLLRDPHPLIDLLEIKTGKSFRRVRFIDDVVK